LDPVTWYLLPDDDRPGHLIHEECDERFGYFFEWKVVLIEVNSTLIDLVSYKRPHKHLKRIKACQGLGLQAGSNIEQRQEPAMLNCVVDVLGTFFNKIEEDPE
jgi:hypothetical protein